ncbi:hypothetical protein HY628_02530 [Candidatus Uhrbacteria bacterium]|nr:hypothetical protein [Candidatus Uhrbacteria bacterium]
MSLRQYLILIVIGTLLSFSTWFLILKMVNPKEVGLLGFVLFYLALAVTLVGIISLAGFGLRMALYRDEAIVLRHVTTAFRHACFFTVIALGSLLLQGGGLLTWWNALLMVMVVTIMEFFFISKHSVR